MPALKKSDITKALAANKSCCSSLTQFFGWEYPTAVKLKHFAASLNAMGLGDYLNTTQYLTLLKILFSENQNERVQAAQDLRSTIKEVIGETRFKLLEDFHYGQKLNEKNMLAISHTRHADVIAKSMESIEIAYLDKLFNLGWYDALLENPQHAEAIRLLLDKVMDNLNVSDGNNFMLIVQSAGRADEVVASLDKLGRSFSQEQFEECIKNLPAKAPGIPEALRDDEKRAHPLPAAAP